MNLRSAVALLLKDAWHHALVVGGFLALGVAALVLAMARAIDEGWGLLASSVGVVYFAGPMLILGVTRRLFVMERLDASHAFLSALPTSPLRVGLLRYLGGLAFAVAWAWANVAFVALLAHRQELLAPGWLLQVFLQCAAYVLAWFSLGFALAQLGRWRFAAWLMLGMTISWAWWSGLEGIGWDAVLGEPIDETRYVTPWREGLVTLTWAAGATLGGFGLLGWRHGDLVERAWTPMTMRARAAAFATVVAYGAALETASVLAPEDDSPGGFDAVPAVPSETAVVRVSDGGDARLRAAAEVLASDLDGLAGWLGAGGWPEVVILAAEPEARAPVWPRYEGADPLVLRVDAEASSERVREHLITRVLAHRTGGQLAPDDRRAWILEGAAWAGIESPTPALRAAWAASQGIGPDDLKRWGATRARLGPDVAGAVAWAGVRALERTGPDSALADALAPRGRWTLRTLLDRWRGVAWDEAAHQSAWLAILEELRAEHAAAVAPIAPLDVEIRREVDAEGRPWLAWTWRSRPVAGAELRWYAMPDLVIAPTEAWPDAERAPAHDREGRVGLDVDARDAVAATIVARSDALDGDVISGWKRLSP